MTTIKLKNGSGAPATSDLVQGEPALDLTNKRLYTEDSGGTVIEVGINPTSLTTGTFTSTGIDDNATSTAITIDSGGDLGVGETNPARRLSVKDSAQNVARFESTSTARAVIALLDANTTDDSSVGIGAITNDLALYSGNLSEGLRLASSGNVGIGETSPDYRLHIKETPANGAYSSTTSMVPTARFHSSEATTGSYTSIQLAANNGSSALGWWNIGSVSTSTNYDNDLIFQARTGVSSYAERMRIDSSGDVLLGTTSTRSSFLTATSGNLNIAGGVIFDAGSGNDAEILNYRSSATVFGNSGAEQVRIDSSGRMIIGNTSSVSVSGGDRQFQVQGTNGVTSSGTFYRSQASTGAPSINLAKDRGSLTTAVISGDSIGAVNFVGSDGTDLSNIGATISATINGSVSDNVLPTDLIFSTNGGSSSTSERMRIDSAGNVGIGAITVNRKLELAGNNNGGAKANYLRITDTDTTATTANQQGGIEFYASDASAGAGVTASMEVVYAGSGGGGEITFNTAANSGAGVAEAMRIDESGNVLIGNTVSPLTLTTGNGHLLTPSGYHGIARDSAASGIYINKTDYTSGNTDLMQFRTNGSVVGDLNYDGTDVLIVQVSDERLKNNITDSASAGSIIDAMQVRSFDWNSGAHVDYGFVAQELNQAYEPATNVGGDDVDEEPWGIKTQKLIPLLVKEIQDLRARVAQLEGE